MKNKRMLVLGIVLILTAIVTGMVFASVNHGSLRGVEWAVDEGGSSGYTMYLYNNNDYKVRFRTSIGQSGYLEAHEERYVNCYKDTTLIDVQKD